LSLRPAACYVLLLLSLTSVPVRCQAPAAAVPAAAAPAPTIDSVAVFPRAASNAAPGQPAPTTQDFILTIKGANFAGLNMADVQVTVIPSTGVTLPVRVLTRTTDNSTILAEFTAPPTYVLQGVALASGNNLVPYDLTTPSCDFKSKVVLTPQIVPKHQAGNKYGNGVAKNFYAIQISIVNECPMAIVVPLAGITVATDDPPSNDDAEACRENGSLVAFSLDHVTSIFSADRKLTGRRAIYFNTVQALATIGSAIEPFLAHGFTQGVSILGGGFTTASKELLVDMSAEQLQNLTSQSFSSTEQVASHGALQKFVFVRRSEKCKNSTVEKDLTLGKFSVNWQVAPASAQAPSTLNAPAQPKQGQRNTAANAAPQANATAPH
jgi:hypothetical protein